MGTTYYVSTTGNNNNAGTKLEQPLRTIQAAVNKVQAGDTIYVRDGVYSERIHVQKAGSTGEPLLISAYQDEKPIIDGGSLSIPEDTALVLIQQSQDITFTGFVIRNSGGRGLFVNKSSRVTVRDCEVTGARAGGIQGSQTDQLVIEKNAVHDCARRFVSYGPRPFVTSLLVRFCTEVAIRENAVFENASDGIAVWVGCQNVTVAKNTCYDNRGAQINVTSARDVTVDSNLCYHTGRKAFLDVNGKRGSGIVKNDLHQYRAGGRWHSRDLRISNNIVVGCGQGFETPRNGGRLTRFQLTHNTVINSTEQGMNLKLDQTSSAAFVENNIVANTNGGDMARVRPADGVIWRNNLWSEFPGENIFNPVSDVVDDDPGLANITAAVSPGVVTVDAYKLLAGSPAIDRGVREKGGVGIDFWGTQRDIKPDIGANEFPGGSSEDEPEDSLPPEGQRVSENLLALYDFKEGQGKRINDVGGVGDALNLTISDTANVSWSERGLLVKSPVTISSERAAKKIIDACKASGELTVEAWVTPSNLSQDGPARIVSISMSKTERNITLGQGLHGNQPADLFVARLRTTKTSSNGLPALVTPAGSATRSLTHLAYTRSAEGRAKLFVNGQERAVLDIDGGMSNWDDFAPFLLANERSNDRPWLGEYRLVAVYSRALRAAEVLHNYLADSPPPGALIADFTIPEGDETGVAPHTVEFDSSGSSGDGGISSYFWEFGDGQTSNRPNPVYTYTKPGVYTVSLTLTDNSGQTSKLTKEQLISVVDNPLPPLPPEYARFVLVDIASSAVVALGIQYPDLRCVLLWNSEPYHMLTYRELEDVEAKYTGDGAMKLLWIDPLETA